MVAAALAALLAYAVGVTGLGRVRLAMVGLTFAAVSSSPVMLSLARQVLQETPGFACAAGTLLAVWAAGRRSSVAAAAVAGALAFLTVRTRYTLGPAVGLLLPLAFGLGRDDGAQRLGRRIGPMAVALGLPFAVGVALDLRRFGPFVTPWVYDAVMVRSSKLFFPRRPAVRRLLGGGVHQPAAAGDPPGGRVVLGSTAAAAGRRGGRTPRSCWSSWACCCGGRRPSR